MGGMQALEWAMVNPELSQVRVQRAVIIAVAPLSAMGLAFLGGLILNLMPCVLPVLSMKAAAFAAQILQPNQNNIGAARIFCQHARWVEQLLKHLVERSEFNCDGQPQFLHPIA